MIPGRSPRWLVLTLLGLPCLGADTPQVTHPRQTSGDERSQPDWEERLVVTVGEKAADIIGADHRAIQAAIDHVARLGGGTVRIGPGSFRLRNAIALRSNVGLVGSGAATVLLKEPSVTTRLAQDSDWYDQEITLEDPAGFRVGDGICLRSRSPQTGGQTIVKRTLVARTGSRFKLDRPLRENLWQRNDATASTLFPILNGTEIENVRIESLVLDGNRQHNAELDGNYAGCIFLEDSIRIEIHGVTARNFHGDGISWQVCHDVVVENCLSENHSGLGLHPGSGSQRPVIRNNTVRGNHIGLFFCWGVKFGLAESNTLESNDIGISIGHRDTDNLIKGNVIRSSRQHALLFRPEHGADFAGHRNRIVTNKFIDNAPEGGAVVDIQGATEAITLTGNEFIDSRPGRPRLAVRKGPDTKNITIEGNRSDGLTGP